MAVRAVRNAGFAGRRERVIDAYWAEARLSFRCEGAGQPFHDPDYAPGHRDIAVGERFLRKWWKNGEGIDFATRHCEACASEMGVERKERRA